MTKAIKNEGKNPVLARNFAESHGFRLTGLFVTAKPAGFPARVLTRFYGNGLFIRLSSC